MDFGIRLINKERGQNMYKVNDVVIYGTEGICRIVDIQDKQFDEDTIKYYILCPLRKIEDRVYAPCNNEKIMERMRPVLTKDEALCLVNSLKDLPKEWVENERERQRVYKDTLLCGSSDDVLSMIHNLYLHQQRQEDKGKKLHAADEKYLKEAETMLLDELAYALEMTKEQVMNSISEKSALQF